MKKIVRIIGIAFVASVPLFTLGNGCSGSKSGLVEESSKSITMSSPTPFMGDEIVIRAPDSDQVRYGSWQVLNETGFDVSMSCAVIENGAAISCVFDEAGQFEITFNGQLKNGQDVVYTSNFDVLDPAARQDQAPMIVLKIKKPDNSIQAVVSTRQALESGSTNFPAGTYVLDLSATQDEDPLNMINFEIKVGNGSFGRVPSTYQFPVGAFPVEVRATDSKGNVAKKSFIAFVSCNTPNGLAISNITATHVSGNIFKYSAAVSGVPAGATVKLIWDYNGDGVYDGDWMPVADDNQKYTTFAGIREIKVKAWDSVCNFQREAKVNLDFATPRLAHDHSISTVDQVLSFGNGSNYFIQADLTGLSGNTTKPANGQFIVTKRPGQKPTDSMKCPFDERTGALQIAGLNYYNTSVSQGRRHGMELRISGINSTSLKTLQTGARLVSAAYRTDAQDDTDLVDALYAQSNCTLQMKIDKAVAMAPCEGSGESVESTVWMFWGKYNCNNMRADSLSLQAMDGAFYCEVSYTDQCVGGGGGGGGQPPVEY